MRTPRFIHTLLFVLLLSLVPAASHAGVFVSVSIAPPILPVYAQPICPAPGYLWTPGYWAYGPAGYYWVPGVWVQPPMVGVLWTPGYWGWGSGVYLWHGGYWGPHVGFYGGVNYGFGYSGVGFEGGYWHGGAFAYNRSVTNVNINIIHNTYNYRVVNRGTVSRTSFNGGAGGIRATATPREIAASQDRHYQPTSNQMAHEQTARNNRAQLASVNHGRPSVTAMSRVGERSNNQQQRIAQGVRSGQMTPGETARAENNEKSINREVRQDRQANGGKLTQQERQNVNQRQNKESRQIDKEKHNDAHDAHPRR
ncbi:MAG TPA: hypothetical protein VHX63_06015 [Acidobacteriaceae bacterium]|jgi:hypothetical protein|nr:hypothetical protein [Acidobacteriaceae bacterium]